MQMSVEADTPRALRRTVGLAVLGLLAACGSDGSGTPTELVTPNTPGPPVAMSVLGRGAINSRYTGEVWVYGNYGYTSTWGTRSVGGVGASGNMIYVWDIRPAVPVLVDSVSVQGASTIGDIQVSSDGRYLVAPTEPGPGYLLTYDLTNPTKPQLISTFTSDKITRGIHTAEIQTIGGKLYAFLSINSAATHLARLMIVDLSTPSQPREVWTTDIAGSIVHDVYVRDGLLFSAQWGNGMVIHDIGGGGRGGSLSAPVQMSSLVTVGGKVHNIWWFQDPQGNSKRYAFVGEEGPASLFTSSSGDIHVVDISNVAAPKEVAFLKVQNAGTHNFSVDEATGFLYAAYYNAGVQALDVRGDLSACTAEQRTPDGRCDLSLMGRVRAIGLLNQNMPVFVWGVHLTGGALYASDMINGLWKLSPLSR